MFKHNFFLICLIVLYSSVSCENYKRILFPSINSGTLHRELTKNQFDHVHITYENISEITKNLLWELSPVKKLEIEFSQVGTIEKGAFRRLISMKKLSLKHNLLEKIENGVFTNLPLEELDLSDNQIKTIEENAFANMQNLRSIKLKNNKIEVYNGNWFKYCPNLCSVNFENNMIKTLSGNVFGIYNVKYCYVDFIMSHNQIEKIEESAFEGAYRFNRLYLDHNAITTIPNIFRYKRVNDLMLNHNRIVCTAIEIKNVEKYNVDDNPWDEECLKAVREQTTTPTTTTIRNIYRFRGIR